MSALYRTHLEEYSEKFKEFFKMKRKNSILEVAFHTNGGAMKWDMETHRAIIPAFFDINCDPDNEVVILTGTGDAFLGEISQEGMLRQGFTSFGTHQAYDIFYYDQTREPLALLELKIPVIAAINGPSIVHAELVLLNDIVICSENTYFQEAHWALQGIVPGDGVHTLFRELLGPNRGRYFLYMGNKIYAEEALQLGLVSEVLPQDKLLDRAWEIAETIFMTKDRIQRRLTRSLLIQPWRELFVKELNSGMAHESFGCYSYWPMAADKKFDYRKVGKE